ncbi:MAG: hypothetical protein M3R38_00185 [Actinomycetota bacterium]|nr:hypothetical protein [Actinomycetota bacterium]
MAQAQQYIFTYKEIAEALVKDQNIHEGLWGIYIEFGIGAANISVTPEGTDVMPAAVVPLQKLGLQKFAEANNMTVDAAEVNPASKAAQAPTDE